MPDKKQEVVNEALSNLELVKFLFENKCKVVIEFEDDKIEVYVEKREDN